MTAPANQLNPLYPLFEGFIKWASAFGVTGDQLKEAAPNYHAGYWKHIKLAEEAYVQRNRAGAQENIKKAMQYWQAGIKLMRGEK